jgi:uncharacterized membrane protein YhaH (DUF805 family)
MNYYIGVLKKYAVFNGRARRAEYWYFALFSIIISIILGIVDNVLGFSIGNTGILGGIYALAVLIPSIAVSIRRLHDTGKSGWMLLVTLIPFIGWIWIIVLMVIDSSPGGNRYGPNPKGMTGVAPTAVAG